MHEPEGRTEEETRISKDKLAHALTQRARRRGEKGVEEKKPTPKVSDMPPSRYKACPRAFVAGTVEDRGLPFASEQ